jgi:hypothetical protein
MDDYLKAAIMMPPERAEPTSLKRLYIFTYPRTASSLLMKILNLPNQSDVASIKGGGYFFLPAFHRLRELNLLERHHAEWTEAEKSEIHAQYRHCFDQFQQFIVSAEVAGCTMVVKEHVPHMTEPVSKSDYIHAPIQQAPRAGSNNTILPDDFLLTWFPTFLIRHPALAFPSYYRIFWRNCQGCEEKMARIEGHLASSMTLRWTRQLYDWYADRCPLKNPIILDANDILSNPKVLIRFCEMVGLDPGQLRFHWDPVGTEQMHQIDPLTQQMNATLLSSSGIIQERAIPPVDLDREMQKWRAEFGETGGLNLAKWVRESMQDYEYLQSRRLV